MRKVRMRALSPGKHGLSSIFDNQRALTRPLAILSHPWDDSKGPARFSPSPQLSHFGTKGKYCCPFSGDIRLTSPARLVVSPSQATTYSTKPLEQIRKITRSAIRTRSVPEGERFLNKPQDFFPFQVTSWQPYARRGPAILTIAPALFRKRHRGAPGGPETCRSEMNAQPTEQSLNPDLVSDSGHVCSPLNLSVKRTTISRAITLGEAARIAS